MKILLYSFLLVFVAIRISNSQGKDESLIYNPVKLSEYVTDETGTLTQAQLDILRKKLRHFFDSSSTQIVVYMISTLNGEPIEEVSASIARFNKIGKKGNNNGLLLLIAKNDHKLRIEVGYGLEGVMTDAHSLQIIRKNISPYFKESKYFEGIDKGTDAMILAAKGEYSIKSEEKNSSGLFSTPFILILVFVLTGIFGLVGFIWWLAVRLSKSAKYIGGSRNTYGQNYYYGNTDYSSSNSSDSYSSSDSSSSSDSGFSGGGGDFGGGGASGDW
jgi:uncharacterized protein